MELTGLDLGASQKCVLFFIEILEVWLNKTVCQNVLERFTTTTQKFSRLLYNISSCKPATSAILQMCSAEMFLTKKSLF